MLSIITLIIICIVIAMLWQHADNAILVWDLSWIKNTTLRSIFRWTCRIIVGVFIITGTIIIGCILGALGQTSK